MLVARSLVLIELIEEVFAPRAELGANKETRAKINNPGDE